MTKPYTFTSLFGGRTTVYYDDDGRPARRIHCPDHYYRDATTRYEVRWSDYTQLSERDPEGAFHVERYSYRYWDRTGKTEATEPKSWYLDALLGVITEYGSAIRHAVSMAEGAPEYLIDDLDRYDDEEDDGDDLSGRSL